MERKDYVVLGIESSCDETSAAVVKGGRELLSNIISTQIELHKKFGGVVPEVASRKHVELINVVIQEALDKAGVTLNDVDIIGATYGPGLVGALLVGLSTAKALSFAAKKKFVGVNHIEGHICANFLAHKELEPPFVCLVVSGGHTNIVYIEDYGKFEIMGRTRDDAAGEAYDKIARALGLGYPGGPVIDKLALQGNKDAVNFPRINLDKSLDFSFSGLKTSVLNYINKLNMVGTKIIVEDVAAAFQEAVVDVLVDKTINAAILKKSKIIGIAGGVASNSRLREKFMEKAKIHDIQIFFPPPILCTDNAAMIASAAYYEYVNGRESDMSLNANPSLRLGQR
ncbi:tRNA N6-adenosine threonylcarbamoyltransferase [Oxobacter pfennigii]|uniref:tRNA N6-adenosine threonylcarbamoyltransferase n=1 Tax=Oxobacter pfennigii TaxID=36849 RepID=A0A0P8YVA9_9CLOT|nr:tRNA (adenosine(37)-N6)-threonylcarbamoyltransferase complex transferase subunit TsaD [Oxobacter pfennigii]KPU43639.1 tRNA N6-adenosine threonylcarbamoyltransferase [Oxobacter pfennigii]